MLKGAEYWWRTSARRVFVEVAIRLTTASSTKAVLIVTITAVWAMEPVGVVLGRAPSFDRNFLTIRATVHSHPLRSV